MGRSTRWVTRHWPLLLAASFCLYAALLLWHTRQSQEDLRTAIDARVVADSQRRASSIAKYLEDRRHEVAEIAERYEIEAYYANKALGMSDRYGLIANLLAIDDYFERKRGQRHANDLPVFGRIALYDENGASLSEGAPARSPVAPGTGLERENRVHVVEASGQVVITAPVFYKGAFRGTVVATSDLRQLTSWLIIGGLPEILYGELVVTQSGGSIVLPESIYRPDREVAAELARLPADVLQPLPAALDPHRAVPNSLVVRSAVRDTPLSLVTLIPRNEVYGNLGSPLFLASLAAFPVLLLVVTAARERLRRRAERLYTDNLRLNQEVARRVALERELVANNTELERLAAELRGSVRRAEEANRAKSEFLATMSHEIRTPMNGILGMAQVLEARSLSDERRRECARVLITSGRALLALLNDILDLAKVEAGRLDLQPTEFSPVRLAHECIALYAESARNKGTAVKVVSELAAERHFVADPYRVRQMLCNLLSNAIKFTTGGTVEVKIAAIEADGAWCQLEFAVTDTGIGIPEDKQALLFRNFTQLDGSIARSHGGSGLGLAIVAKLARLMKGEAGVASEPGRGSRFWFRVQAGTVAVATRASPPPDTGGVPSSNVAPARPIDAVAATAIVAPARPIDAAAATAIVARLLPLLDDHLFDAVDVAHEFVALARGTVVAGEADQLGRLLEALDFDGAAARLRALASAEGWMRDVGEAS